MKTKLWAVIAAAAVILVIALIVSNGCNKPVAEDPFKQKYDSLLTVIEDQKAEIEKMDELISYYATQYDSTAKVNDSLQHRGVRTIVKYREVKVAGDTSELIAICDSLADEYSEFIAQTKVTIAAADSVMSAQSSQIGNLKDNNATLQELVNTLKDKIDQQEKEIDKWRKLAKRRGRAIEW